MADRGARRNRTVAVLATAALVMLGLVAVVVSTVRADPGLATATTALPGSGTVGGWRAGSCVIVPLVAGRRPPACWRPFAASAPFNVRLPSDPRLLPRSGARVRALARRGPPAQLVSGNGGYDYEHATYFASRLDPIYRVHCKRRWGRCAAEGRRFRVPAVAKPAGYRLPRGTGDRHLSVVQPDGQTTLELWRTETPSGKGGRLRAGWGGVTRLDGSGLGSGSTAAGFSGLAGVIRVQDLVAGHIDHALFASVPCTVGHVYPASQGAFPCRGRRARAALPNGARLQLVMSDAEIDALPDPPWTKVVLRALRRYGMIIGDTGGTPDAAFGLQFESGAVDRAFGRPEALDAYAAANGIPSYADPYIGRTTHLWRLPAGVDWGRRLRVVAPCLSRRTC